MKTLIMLLFVVKLISSYQLKSTILKESSTFSVKYVLENPTNQTIKLLKWGTPLDYQKDMFLIMGPGGKRVNYIEKIFKRLPPREQDFLTLSPQSSYSEVINLADYYSFPVKGVYIVALEEQGQEENVHIMNEKKNVVFIYVEEPITGKKIRELDSSFQITEKVLNTEYINCNTGDDRKVVEQSIQIGQREANCARNCVNNNSCAQNYVKWFGVMDANRYSRVRSNFEKIAVAFTQSFKIYCRHKDCIGYSATAYVYPSDRTRTIYLCPGFFRNGEKPETIVHEMSHFNTVAGTDDFAYGRQKCVNLARSDPSKAIANADNKCYFANECTK